MPVLIEAAGLRYRYGRRRGDARPGEPSPVPGEGFVIRDVSLAVPRGAFVGVLGPNGSGKTTLLKLVAGALHPTAGTLTIGGTPVSAIPRRALSRRLAVVPQETHLAFDYTVLEMVLMGRYPHLGAFEVEGPDISASLRALEVTGTREFAERPFPTLSGGEKQRVIIASALAQLDDGMPDRRADGQPPILDEPTASLDLRYQIEVTALLKRLHADRGMTVLLSTHDLRLARAVCTDLVLLSAGQVLAHGAPADAMTPDLIGRLYGIDSVACGADSRTVNMPRPTPSSPLHRGPPVVALCFLGMVAAVVAAPFIGSTSILFGRSSAGRCRSGTTWTRRSSSSRGCRGRWPRRSSAARWRRPAWCFRGCCATRWRRRHARRLGGGVARRDGGHHLRRRAAHGRRATASLTGALVAVLIVYALANAHQRGLSTTVLLLSASR